MRLKKKNALSALIFVVVLACIGWYIYYLNQPVIQFVHGSEEVEIHGTYDAKEFIKKVRGYNEEDVVIDTTQVNVEKLGEYVITYEIDGKTYKLDINVVDSIPPVFDAQNMEFGLGQNIEAKSCVKNIRDETETKVYFKEEYDFTKEGQQDVIVIVEDEGGNKTEKSVQIKIVKDTEKPTLTGLHDITTTKNKKVDYMSGIKAKDNQDPNPKVEVDSSQVDLSKLGTYEIKYTVTDQSGNQNTYIQKVIVSNTQSVTTKGQTGEKFVYLTFDDGPSKNTAKILDVLDKYNAKATFFVTGNGQNYNYLIKKAHDKGHTIGLHTYSHDYSKVYASVNAYFNDLDKVGQMVKGQIGFVPKYIRFPGGASNTVSRHYCKGIMSTLVKEVQNRGYQYYDWNASTGDASGNNIAVSKLVKGGTSSKANNIMILAHDTAAKSTTVQALPQIIEHYQALGYTFKGIDDSTFTPHQHVNN